MKKNANIEKFDQDYYFYCERHESIIPDAFELFLFYDSYFFQNALEASEVKWSKRMTLCAGTCKLSSQNSCTITLSESLLQFRNSNELKETLLHEMIHAFLFLNNPKACLVDGGHGEEFKNLMKFINSVTGLNITVYHDFIEEVEQFRKHVWKCNGPCQNQQPFFGICKRSMNRPPQKSDRWFADHQKIVEELFLKLMDLSLINMEKSSLKNKLLKKPKKEKNDNSQSQVVIKKQKERIKQD